MTLRVSPVLELGTFQADQDNWSLYRDDCNLAQMVQKNNVCIFNPRYLQYITYIVSHSSGGQKSEGRASAKPRSL